MDVMVVQLMVFASAVLLVSAVAAMIRGDREKTRLEQAPAVFRVFQREIEVVGRLIEPALNRANPAKMVQLRQDIVAGTLTPLDVMHIYGLQGLAAVMLGGLSSITVFALSMNIGYGLIALFVAGLLGWIYPVTWLHGVATRRKDAMSRSLPYAIDLLTVAMQAGQDFGAAVRHLVMDGPSGPLRQEFAVLLRETELGKSRIEALKAMSERIQLEEFRALVTSVVQSSEMGASIAQTLKVQAEEIRRARYHKAERQAARAPSLMIIPVALFILPSVFIMIFVPIILRIQGSGLSMF